MTVTILQSGKVPVLAASLSLFLLTSCGVARADGGMKPPSASPTVLSRSTKSEVRFFYPLPYPVSNSSTAAQPITSTPTNVLPSPHANKSFADKAATLGVVRGPPVAVLRVNAENARAALSAFRQSCSTLLSRTDNSGLTRTTDWQSACSAAYNWPNDSAVTFFNSYLTTVQVGDGRAFATGYYEPEIAASRTRQSGYQVPIYRRPPELQEQGSDSQPIFVRKRSGGSSHFSLQRYHSRSSKGRYHDRAEIERGALDGRGLEIAWAADPVEFFFLQIQGSGRLRFPDGSITRIGYDGQNGHNFVGIGGLLNKRGALKPNQSSMQGLTEYLRANPQRGAAVMRENPRWIFFREIRELKLETGPVGAIGVNLTSRASVAVDSRFIPLGAPVFLSLNRVRPNGLWIAQDSGSAIKGPNRVDTFWGAGEDARAIAGGMAARGAALILLPHQSVKRLIARR